MNPKLKFFCLSLIGLLTTAALLVLVPLAMVLPLASVRHVVTTHWALSLGLAVACVPGAAAITALESEVR
jgi:hypothetical protein